MGAYTFDMTRFPLVVLTAQGSITPEQFHEHLKEYKALLSRGKTYALVFDATAIETPDAKMRQDYAAFLKEHEDMLRQHCVGCSFVITSRVIRGALTAMLWLMGNMPFPYDTFASRDEAVKWARQRLGKE